MLRQQLIFLFTVIALIGSIQICYGEEEKMPYHNVITSEECGPRALYIVLKIFGRNVDYDKLCVDLKVTQKEGCSLLDLEQVAEGNGLLATGRKISVNQLKDETRIGIIHLNKGCQDETCKVKGMYHFSVYLGYCKKLNKYVVADFLIDREKILYVSEEDLVKAWTSYILFFEEAENDKEES